MSNLAELAKLFLAGEEVTWRDYAACKDADTDIFFVDVGESNEEARAYCSKCPVIQDCLHFAVSTNQKEGFWGGRTTRQRRGLRKEYVRAGYAFEDQGECLCQAPAVPEATAIYSERHNKGQYGLKKGGACERALACRRMFDRMKRAEQTSECWCQAPAKPVPTGKYYNRHKNGWQGNLPSRTGACEMSRACRNLSDRNNRPSRKARP